MKTPRRTDLMAFLLSLACSYLLAGNAALAQEPVPHKAAGETLTIDLAKAAKPWTGDLDGMIERRFIRVLTVNSKTIHFVDKGVLRGTAVEYVRPPGSREPGFQERSSRENEGWRQLE